MSTYHFSVELNARPQTVFEKLVDFASYPSWLSETSSFSRVTDIDPLPMRTGTRFVDRGKIGKRYGTVTVFEPPQRLGFTQPMETKFLGTIDVAILYKLTAQGERTSVERILDLECTSPAAKLLGPIITRAIKSENRRILNALERQFP